jgi:uncharacterized protein YegP (UPF0339 family)/uncharacterized surface protein with fasciclin (FAS1) repeats
MEDIVDIAVEAGGFKTFVTAVRAVGLVELLKGKGPFTIFAPDDRAFALLPAGTVDELLKGVPKLKSILMYHVIPGKFTIDEIAQMKTAKTVQGQELKIHGSGWWHLHINPIINDDAHIISTDIVTESGIIHVVDRVLMPNMELTCPIDGMGFLTMQALDDHNKTAHVVEKTPEAPMPAEVTLMVEKAPEPMPSPEVMPVVAAVPEQLLPTEVITEQMPEAAKVTGVFEVFYDSVCRFRFHLKATNGQIIAVSQSYGSKEASLKGIASIKKNAPIAKIADFTTAETMRDSAHRGVVQDPVFEIQCDIAGKFRFHLKAANGEIIAASQSYLSRQSAENGIASVKKNAPMAKIIDQSIAVT